jgi:hypothetical protein
MTGRTWTPFAASLLAPFAVFAFFLGIAAAHAQTVGPDEAVNPEGAVTQQLALTPAQKSAIYNAVLRQRVRASNTMIAGAIPVAVGAPVSPAVGLSELPEQAATDMSGGDSGGDSWADSGADPWASSQTMFLKYAMVGDDVVVVDPVTMRVVDIIHGSTRP